MAFLLAFHPLRSKAGATLFACVGLFGAATVAFGLSTNVTLSVVALVVLGAGRPGERRGPAHGGAIRNAP